MGVMEKRRRDKTRIEKNEIVRRRIGVWEEGRRKEESGRI